MVRADWQSYIGTRLPVSAGERSKQRPSAAFMMKRPARKLIRYAVCVDNGRGYYAVDLIPRKIYEIWPDAEAEPHRELRVVDESGEDYLYPAEYFRIVELPAGADRLFRSDKRRSRPRRRAASRTRR
jgi:hypothetical protein